MDAAAIIADLDDAQRHAVTTDNRLVAVIAGAGSGKTRVLTRRVAYRAATETADPSRTLVLTFTREAAGELRRRLPRLGLERPVTAGTFHSVCRQLLIQRWADRDERAPTMRSDRHRILREVVGPTDQAEFAALSTAVDLAASNGWDGAAYRREVADERGRRRSDVDRAAVAIDAYRNAKLDRGVIDLDDLLGLCVDALESDSAFADAVRWRFQHLLVDEAQDLNPLQQRLVDRLRVGNDDLFVVGDPAQSIFGFNGSDPRLLIEVGRRFPGIEVIRLPTNHRSTPQVVDAGRHVLATAEVPTSVESRRDEGQIVTIERHDNEHSEAVAVAAAIGAIDPHLLRRNDVAVLGRTHAVLDLMRSTCEVAGIPIHRVAAGAGSPIASHLRSLYRLAHPHQMRQWAQDHRELATETGDEALGSVVETVLGFLREQPTGTGTAFEAWVDLTNPFGDQSAGVEVLTFHAAKGREWNTVFLVGCETSLVPHRSATTAALRAEEARLLYVAMTRATDRLVVNWAERRGGYQRKLTPLLDGFTSTSAPVVAPHLPHIDRPARDDLLDRIHAWRLHTAQRASLLPTQILSDPAVAAVADHPPATAAELDAITGVGPMTAARLFPGLAAAIASRG